MPNDPLLPIELGDGLRLRQSRAEDVDALAAFNAEVHRNDAPEPLAWIDDWTRDLLSGRHPTHEPDCFTVVEEAATGRIVSALNLIPQTWSYGGAPIGVGQVELVGTDPEYRRRGLIRRQMEVVHRWGAERGQLAQTISGIPWYYRQFGYEYALEMDHARFVALDQLPTPKEGEAEPFRLRPAAVEDAPLCLAADARGRTRYLVACLRDEPQWRYEIAGRSRAPLVEVVETADGRPLGYVVHEDPARRQGPRLRVNACELLPDVSWLEAGPSILRGVAALGREGASEPLHELALALGREHPLYRWLRDLRTRRNRGYAWYVRVADLPAFMRRIAPVLEARLAASDAVGYGGDLRLSFYRAGLHLAFEAGRLTIAEPWAPGRARLASAAFPDLTFLQLLFGYRSMAELNETYPDCVHDDARMGSLLDVLFPKRPSTVYALS